MAQTWKLGVQNVRPGTYFRVSSGDVTTVGAVNGIAAVMFRANWGPLNKVVDVDQSQMNNLDELFGTYDGVNIIKEALLGGATLVRAVRVGGDGGAASYRTFYAPTKTVSITKTYLKIDSNGVVDYVAQSPKMVPYKKDSTFTVYYKSKDTGKDVKLEATTDYTIQTTVNAAGTEYTVLKVALTTAGKNKVNTLGDGKIKLNKKYSETLKAVKVTARYPGDRTFTGTVKTDLATGKRQFLVYDGTKLFDSVSFEAGGDEAQALVDALATNKNFKAVKYNATKLADVTGREIEGGVDPTYGAGSYARGLDILERYYWNVVLAASDLPAVHILLNEYVKQSYEMGHLGMTVIGSSSKTPLEDRLAYATALNDWRIVYILNGWTDINGVKYEGWRAAARIGGMIAACETNASLTHIVVNNALELIEPLTNGEIIRAEEKGCLVLSLNDEDQVWIDNAINSLITLGNDQDEGWKKIRRTKCRFELMTRINRTCDRLIGRLNNDANGRATLITAMQGIINEMCAEGKLFFGSYVAEDERYKPAGDKAYFMLYIGDIDSIEKIYLDFRFSYANPFSE